MGALGGSTGKLEVSKRMPSSAKIMICIGAYKYRSGLRKPTGGFLACALASFNKDTIDANAGVEAEVPEKDLLKNPPTTW